MKTSVKHLGCDPELFLKHKETGKFISSIGLIGGSKDFPMPIGEGCAVQEDNVAVEFNTPPCASADDFVKHINYTLEKLKEVASRMDLQLAIIPSARFDDDQLDNEAAQTFGCDPDFNAWRDGRQNPRPKATDGNLRSAGGHIHVETDLDPIDVVRAMDLFVGCMMIEFDTDTSRRELYGKAGAFRKKSYGVEYRTASNAWITSDERIRWAWDQTEKALKFVEDGHKLDDDDGTLIQKCINESDLGALEQLKDKFAFFL
jgi:hypothetical protein